MYSLNDVIRKFKSIIKENRMYDKSSPIASYYEIIVRYLLLEHKYQSECEASGKLIYYYFKYSLPMNGHDYFNYLYNPYNPVRFAVETFDSIEVIRNELNNLKNK